jgi:hypothetical protein
MKTQKIAVKKLKSPAKKSPAPPKMAALYGK